MFDAVRNNKKIVQVFLALITLPFAFFGVESYVRNFGDDGQVAKIGDMKISQQQFQQAMREQQERLRAQFGSLDPKMFDNPEARKAILDDMIDQRLLLQEANKRKLVVSDQAIRGTIVGIPAFQENGKFSPERYEAALRAQGMSPAGFEAQLRQDIALQLLAGALGQSGFVSTKANERLLALQTEQREVAEAQLPLATYLDKVKLEQDAAKKFYEANGKRFEIPEQVRVEYTVLSQEALGSQLSVSENEVKAWYDGHKDRYSQSEERRASHILIALEKAGGKDKARTQAESVLAEVQKNPAAFAELARKHSQDPGSAEKGGDLGFFGKGAMVKPFEDAVFKQKEGEISGLVESDFGFHIIKVTGIHAAREKPLADVRAEIEGELKKGAATRRFAEAAEMFSNTVYEQSDSLKPAADRFKLAVKESGWLTRVPNPANGTLANEKLLTAVFSEEALKNKRNTEAVEIAPNTLVAARVVEHKPLSQQAFEAVRSDIEKELRQQEAIKLARQDGEAKLLALRKGEAVGVNWGPGRMISRLDAGRLPPSAAPAIFKADTAKLPAFVGAELPGAGYGLFKIGKVQAGEALDERSRQILTGQMRNVVMQEDVQAYLAALRSRYKVEVNQAALEVKDR